jgi:hypothetical protein
MGGFNSGRRPTQPAVEDGLTLDPGQLLRHGNLPLGRHVAGTLTWTRQPSGEHAGEIGYEADMRDRDHASLRLQYSRTSWDGTKTVHDYRVELVTTIPPFGGVRWWFLCPRTGRLASKLYLPPGASRVAFRMGYQSQRRGPLFRAQDREARVVRKLGATYRRPLTPRPPRPKWMRHKTYARLCGELERWQTAQDWAFVAATEGLIARAEREGLLGKGNA